MKFHRSTKCSLKFATASKRERLRSVLAEYGRVVNQFIDQFWEATPRKNDLLKPIVDSPETWLSARLRKVAAREAIDMVAASKERWKEKAVMPKHRGLRMHVSSTIAQLDLPKNATSFDCWLHLFCIGNRTIIDLPIKLHKHINNLLCRGKRLNAYIITPDYVQFCFEITTEKKKQPIECVGVDTGINALASLSTGEQLGTDVKSRIERIKRCKHGSKGQKRARRSLRQYIDEIAKQTVQFADLIVVENLKGITNKTKLKRRLSKNMRRSIGSWNVRYWLTRLQQQCEWNRVSFRTVSPWKTSQTCPSCGHVDRSNRCGESFSCRNCGRAGNADIIAAENVLQRHLTGAYGPGCEPKME